MLTPVFSITQTPDVLILDIRAPYADLASTEVSIVDDEFRFYSKPYFLRLHLPGRIVETGNEVVNYDFEKKEFRLHVAKETPGSYAIVSPLLMIYIIKRWDFYNGEESVFLERTPMRGINQ